MMKCGSLKGNSSLIPTLISRRFWCMEKGNVIPGSQVTKPALLITVPRHVLKSCYHHCTPDGCLCALLKRRRKHLDVVTSANPPCSPSGHCFSSPSNQSRLGAHHNSLLGHLASLAIRSRSEK